MNDQKLEPVIAFFAKKASTEVVSSLTRQDTSHFGLTPLMIAVMKGHVAFAKFLLDSIKERTSREEFIKHLNTLDSNGFTVLHHAAIAAPSFINILLENGANPKAKTKPGYSYEHLRLLTDPTLKAESAEKTFWEVNGVLKKVSELTPAEKERIGISYFRDLCLYQGPSGLRHLWESNTPIGAQSPRMIGCPNASLKSLPELEIRRHPSLPEGNVGLFTRTFLPPGTLISTYGGKFTSQITFFNFDAQMRNYWEGKENEYLWEGGIVGQRVCSPMTRANSGFPNAVQQPILVDGMPIEAPLIVMAPEGLLPGEEVIYDYGPNACFKWDKQMLVNKEGIDEYDWLNDPESLLRERNSFRHWNRYRIDEAFVPIKDMIETLRGTLQEMKKEQHPSSRDYEVILREQIEDFNKELEEEGRLPVEELERRVAKMQQIENLFRR
ncbi:MAG: ankyrin repeat domain-containing protein [Chlamydiales bacterium]